MTLNHKSWLGSIFIASSIFVSGMNSFAQNPGPVFCVGEQAMNRNYDVIVEEIYSNGTAKLKFLTDGSEGVYPISEIIKIVPEMNGFHQGEKAMNRNYDVIIEEIYANATAKLKFNTDGSEGIYPLNEIVHVRRAENGWNVGDSGMNRNYDVTIEEIFENATARLRFDTDGSEGVYPLAEIIHIVPYLDGFRTGEEAMNRNYDVQIQEIYSNHTARLLFHTDNSSGVYPLNEVVKKLECTGPCPIRQ